jgi:hypothetical protein
MERTDRRRPVGRRAGRSCAPELGGRLALKSPPGEGTMTSIELPLGQSRMPWCGWHALDS